MDHDRTIVVGGGIAGLTAATLIASRGRDVCLFEGGAAIGGRARSRDVDGTPVNLGAHALYLHGPGIAVLDRLGIDRPGRLPPWRGARFAVGGELVRPGSAAVGGVGALLRAVRGLLTASRDRPAPDVPLTAWLDGTVGEGPQRRLVEAYLRIATYGWAPRVQSAEVAWAQLRAARVVRYLDGGWQSLVDALTERAVAAGVSVRTGRPVATVTTADGRVTGVTDRRGTREFADTVVLAGCHPHEVARLLATTPAGPWAAGVADATSPVRVATLDVVLHERPRGHTPFVVGLDDPLFVTTAHEDPGTLDRRGRLVLHVTRTLPPGTRSGAEHRGAMEALLDRSSPGWRDVAVDVRFLPAITVSHDLAAAATGGLGGRPGPAVPGVRGLAIAGDWVGGDGYLAQASLCSAAAAATHVTAPSAATRTVRSGP